MREKLYLEIAEPLRAQEYLEAVWLLENGGEQPARISSVADLLDVSRPSVVQMLQRLEAQGYLRYYPRKGVELTRKGAEIGRRMVRNGMLVEILMVQHLRVKVDERAACGIEHHLTDELADAVCTMLNHPSHCPHGTPIPPGKCCAAQQLS